MLYRNVIRIAVIVFIVVTCMATFLVTMQSRNTLAKERQQVLLLANLWERLSQYDYDNNRLPKERADNATGPVVSWRAELLTPLHKSVYKVAHLTTWKDYLANRKADPIGMMFAVDPGNKYGIQETECLAIRGNDTAFDSGKRLSALPSDVILVVHIPKSGIHWAQPDDIHVDELDSNGNVLPVNDVTSHGSFKILFADGSVWALKNAVPYQALLPFLTIGGAESNDREVLLGSYVVYRNK